MAWASSLNRGRNHFVHTAVMPEVNHLHPRGLNDSTHDIDGSVVAVKK